MYVLALQYKSFPSPWSLFRTYLHFLLQPLRRPQKAEEWLIWMQDNDLKPNEVGAADSLGFVSHVGADKKFAHVT